MCVWQFIVSFPYFPGGVEALVQLSIALSCAVEKPDTLFVGPSKLGYNNKWKYIYGSNLITRIKSLDDMKSGDIFITSELMPCPRSPPGVLVFVWLLGTNMTCQHGVRYLAHNLRLANFTFDGKHVSLPLERVIHPYISPPLVHHAQKVSALNDDGSISYHLSKLVLKKENLILTDSDVPVGVLNVLHEVANMSGFKVIHLKGLNNAQIIDAYERGKVVIDWCMRGSERCPMEAVLHGALLLTNDCETGGSFVDFPIASKFILAHSHYSSANYTTVKTILLDRLNDMMINYWEYVPLFAPFRQSILQLTPKSMIVDVKRFLGTVQVDENSTSSQWLMPGGCKGCRV